MVETLPLRTLVQIALLVFAVLGAAGCAFSQQRGHTRCLRLALALLTFYALGNIAFVVFLWLNHAAFPLNLEAMELTMLQHVNRVLDGAPLYPEPSPKFIALAYNPLFYYLAAPFVSLFDGLLGLRLAAILGTLGAGITLFLIVRRRTSSAWWGLIAIGLFAAAYRVMDTYLDMGHIDSWVLFLLLLAGLTLDRPRSTGANLAAVLLGILAFWFKQSAAVFTAGILLFITFREGWRSWPYWLLAGLLGPALYFAMPDGVLGPYFHFYTWDVPRNWVELNLSTLRRFAGFVLGSFPALAGLALAGAGLAWARRSQRGNPWYFLLPFALLNGLQGALDPESNNNVFIPLGTWFIIAGSLALWEWHRARPAVERNGLQFLALAISFALFVYNPLTVIISPQAPAAYRDLVGYLNTQDGPVYAPWIGQLQDGYQFYPSVHWVPLTDLVRGPSVDIRDNPVVHRYLTAVEQPTSHAHILMNARLENDPALAYLADRYTLAADLGDRFASLVTLPRRYFLGYPRFLYEYDPENQRNYPVDKSGS